MLRSRYLNSWVRIKSSLLFWCARCSWPKAILKNPFDEFKRIESNNWSRRYGTPSIRPQRPKWESCTIWEQIVVTARRRRRQISSLFYIVGFGSILFILFISTIHVCACCAGMWLWVRRGVPMCLCASEWWSSYVHSHRMLNLHFWFLLNIFHPAFGAKCSIESTHTHTQHPLTQQTREKSKQHKKNEKKIKEMKEAKENDPPSFGIRWPLDNALCYCHSHHSFQSQFFDWIQTRTHYTYTTGLLSTGGRTVTWKLQTTRVANINSIFKYLSFKWKIDSYRCVVPSQSQSDGSDDSKSREKKL